MDAKDFLLCAPSTEMKPHIQRATCPESWLNWAHVVMIPLKGTESADGMFGAFCDRRDHGFDCARCCRCDTVQGSEFGIDCLRTRKALLSVLFL
jgi:hypothetical protein